MLCRIRVSLILKLQISWRVISCLILIRYIS
nr:MAG TPA_asm: hypothetical protein [Bacteriophage sp.]